VVAPVIMHLVFSAGDCLWSYFYVTLNPELPANGAGMRHE
jgi:hypothetical protein